MNLFLPIKTRRKYLGGNPRWGVLMEPRTQVEGVEEARDQEEKPREKESDNLERDSERRLVTNGGKNK